MPLKNYKTRKHRNELAQKHCKNASSRIISIKLTETFKLEIVQGISKFNVEDDIIQNSFLSTSSVVLQIFFITQM